MTTENTTLHSATTDPLENDTVETGPLVGNPRRTRGLDASALSPRPATSDMVGNPRRTRHLDAAVVDAA